MANPNIAALNELHVGTLAWNLKTSQAIVLKGGDDYDGASTTETSTPWLHSAVGGITLSNRILFVASITDQASYTTGITYSDDALTLLTATNNTTDSSTKVSMYDVNYDFMSLGYRLAPEANEVGNLVLTASSSEEIGFMFLYAANIDQTTPFRALKLPHNLGDVTQQFVHGTGGSQNTVNSGINNPFMVIPPQPGELGDLSLTIDQWQSNGYHDTFNGAGQHTFGRVRSGDAASSVDGTARWQGFQPGGFACSDIESHFQYQVGHTQTGDAPHAVQAVMQSSRTKDTLITCPSDRVLKINSIRATNPEVTGIYVNVDLEGLGAINDTAGSAAVTPTGNDATVTIARSVRVPENGVELLSHPLYMVEGDILKANAKMNKHFPQWNEMRVDIIVSFESMED